MRLSSNTKIAILLLALSLTRGMIYSAVVPPWQAPDEFKHFEYVKLVNQNRRLITRKDQSPDVQREIVASMMRYDYPRFGLKQVPIDPDAPPQSFREIQPLSPSQLYQPPLYYLLAATALIPIAEAEVTVQLYVTRLVSVILGALTVLAAFLTTKEVFPDNDFLIIGVPAFVAILPMHTFITSSVNSDNLAELLVSLLILASARVMRRGMSWQSLLSIVALVALGQLTKRTALVAIPFSLTIILLSFRGKPFRSLLEWKRIGLILGILVVSTIVGVSQWSNWQGMFARFFDFVSSWLVVPSASSVLNFVLDSVRYGPQAAGLDVAYMVSMFGIMFESFWARFGWLNITISGIWYQTLGVVTITSFVGLVLFVVRLAKQPHLLAEWQWKSLLAQFSAVVFAIAIIVIGMFRASTFMTWRPRPQGRYLFPVIIPIATLFMIGLEQLLPRRYHRILTLGCIGALVILDSIALGGYIIPFFYY